MFWTIFKYIKILFYQEFLYKYHWAFDNICKCFVQIYNIVTAVEK